MKNVILMTVALMSLQLSAHAKDSSYTRGFECVGDDARMEVYFPQDVVFAPEGLAESLKKHGRVLGVYALDLTGADKGKSLEPVYLSLSVDGRSIRMNQFTRPGLPVAKIPLSGGTLDFDHRFGTNAKCEALHT